jgi:gliding motility-associated-like protein
LYVNQTDAMKKITYLLMFVMLSIGGFAQLTVTNAPPYNSPAYMVQNVLVGTGVQVSNITYQGAANTSGFFNGQNTNLGINSGMLITCGLINNALGPNNNTGQSQSNNLNGDPDLDIIMSPTLSYDVSILEFDFIPMSDTVKFNYVFASEEYMEYVSSQPGGINDGFGFFISGPGINGPFSNNAANIALLPNGNPVTMFNVNCNPQNSIQYICNDPTNSSTWNACPPNYNCPTSSAQTTHQYDGQTIVMTAISAVQCGQTYHIKIAIADGGDHILDSGVFLEAGSFSSQGIIVGSASTVGGNINGNDSTLYEGCGSLVVYFDRGNNTSTQDTVCFSILGNATNGVDYATLQNCIIFPIGVDSVAYTISANMDANNEGPETIQIVVPQTGPCTQGVPDTITITILNVIPPSVIADHDTICPYDNATISAQGQDGMPGYSYLWNTPNADTTSTVNLSPGPGQSTTYQVTITDTCGNTATTLVAVIVTKPTANFGYTFVTANSVDFMQTSTPVVSYFWDFGDGNTSTLPNPNHTYPNDQTYYFTVMLVVVDANGCSDTISEVITIYPDFYFYTPNTVTPNGDGKNDVYNASGMGILKFQLMVFNRWGEMIFKSTDINQGWDGKFKGDLVQEDTYVAVFDIVGPNERKVHKVVNVNVIR